MIKISSKANLITLINVFTVEPANQHRRHVRFGLPPGTDIPWQAVRSCPQLVEQRPGLS
jgi:hypothetical protein